MYLKRKIYDRLVEWKRENSGSTLEVDGARQVGKTYIINKFADENFKSKIVEMDILDFKPGRRCFFMDLGVANYYLKRVGTTDATVCGMLNENYVFINLLKRQDFPEEIAFEMPAFATYRGGEIDYVVQSIKGQTRYLIEVKAGKGTAPTAQKALKDGKADKLIYLKGNTKGGQKGNILTLPVYMLERFFF